MKQYQLWITAIKSKQHDPIFRYLNIAFLQTSLAMYIGDMTWS